MSDHNEGNVSFFPTAVKNGLIIGVVLIIISLIHQLMGWTSSIAMTMLVFFLSVILYIVASYRAIKEHRDIDLGGGISFGRAFFTGFVAAVTAGVIGAVFAIVYINFIDPDSIEKSMEMAADMMERMGASEDDIDQAMAEAEEKASNPISLFIQNAGTSMFFGIVCSLILAAIMKKETSIS